MNEPTVFGVLTKTMPDDVRLRIDEPGFAKRTATHLEIHNVYGMLNSEATYEGMLALRPNERPFVMTRASLVAPNPSPDEIAPYEVHMPPGTWFDYWTGEQFERTRKTQASDLEQRDKLDAN